MKHSTTYERKYVNLTKALSFIFSKKRNLLQFYERNLSKNEGHEKSLQFYSRNPFKINDTKNYILIINLNLIYEIPSKMNDIKKLISQN